MMKKYSILSFIILIMFFSLVACSNLDSFQGKIEGIEENQLLVDCTDAVNRNKSGDIPAVGYLCNVHINDNLMVIDQKGDQIDVNLLKSNQVVEVILDKPKNIGTSPSSREVEAKEILVLSED